MIPFLKKSLSTFKKGLLMVLVIALVFTLFSGFLKKDRASLQDTNSLNMVQKNRNEIYKTINDPKLNKTPEGKITTSIFRLISCKFVGEACTNIPGDGDKNFSKSSFGFVSNLITVPFVNPPASGVAWAYNGLQQSGFIPKTYAAEGIGLGSIQPFAKIWIIFRDIAYLLLVVVLVIIGFMVMFRAKINPQTVISVENALPRIIIALILITFSFAIAGFMIDLMYVLIAIIVSVLAPVYSWGGGLGAPQNATQLQQYYLTAGPGAAYWSIGKLNSTMANILNIPDAILGIIPELGYFIRVVGGAIILFMGQNIIKDTTLVIVGLGGLKDIFGSLSADGMPGGLGASLNLNRLLSGISSPLEYTVLIGIVLFVLIYLIPLVLGILIWFSLVFVFFRIIFMLFSSYIKVLLNIIFAPFFLLLEAVPGQSSFVNWLKNLAGNLIVFPVVVGVFILGSIVSDAAASGNLVRFPFLVGIDPKSFSTIVGVIILFLTPEFATAARALFIPKPGFLDQASPSVLFGGAAAATGGAMGAAGQFGSISLALGALGPTGAFAGLGKRFGISRFIGPAVTDAPKADGNVKKAGE